MSVLVYIEGDGGKVKKSSIEAVCFGAAMDQNVTAITFGAIDSADLAQLGNFGAKKVMHVASASGTMVQENALAIFHGMEAVGANTLVTAKSTKSDAIAARVASKLGGSIVTNVVEVPDGSGSIKRSIYSGKAFAYTKLTNDKHVFVIKKNAIEVTEGSDSAIVEAFEPDMSVTSTSVNILSTEKTTGDVLLPEAEIVVSAGRGLKGPENWGMIEELAKSLGAATACSKPVSDMEWRPHHEHVGQTGIKVSPNLYIAIGISGAIQHLAGVNSSKVIVVINKDEDAPFFKAADYGIVGDAFDIVPKLTAAINAMNN